jgi:hypothetical protein
MVRALRAAPVQPEEPPDLRGRERAVQHLLARGADVVRIPSSDGERASANGLVSEA